MTDKEKIQRIKEIIWDWAIREVRKEVRFNFKAHIR